MDKKLIYGLILLIEGILIGMFWEYASPAVEGFLILIKPAEVVMRNL